MLDLWGYGGPSCPCPDPPGSLLTLPMVQDSISAQPEATGLRSSNTIAVLVFDPISVHYWWGPAVGTQPCLVALQKCQGCWWTLLLALSSAYCGQALQDGGCWGGHWQPWGPPGTWLPSPRKQLAVAAPWQDVRMNFDRSGMFPFYVIPIVFCMHFVQYWASLFGENFRQTVKQESNTFYVSCAFLSVYNYA